MADRRGAEAKAYRSLYKTARWLRTREDQLASEPLCRMCAAAGRVTAADTCDHVEPHRGNIDRFWSGPFQSLCGKCHNDDKQTVEHGGLAYHGTADASGWPTDPRHPANATKGDRLIGQLRLLG